MGVNATTVHAVFDLQNAPSYSFTLADSVVAFMLGLECKTDVATRCICAEQRQMRVVNMRN